MDPDRLLELLQAVADGSRTAQEAARSLETLPFSEVAESDSAHQNHPAESPRVHARVDHHRAVRTGFPEVVFCQGKTAEQVAAITAEILAHGDVVLATRATPEQHAATLDVAPDAVWHEAARLIVVDRRPEPPHTGHIVVATGGTADIPVAEEAATCAEVMGCRVTRLFDVGVAGLHRLLAHTDTLRSAHAIIAVAGMEGALPSLVAGLVDVPVIAVPTSVGYGANFGGVSALLTMLNSCAGGIGVVNIDNGFGAAVLATRINRPPARLAAGRAESSERDAAAGAADAADAAGSAQ
jgi:NCAIR mutase (PurE)-related protein